MATYNPSLHSDHRAVRLTITVGALVLLLAIAVIDAVRIQREAPRDRIWLLILMFIMPSLFAAIGSWFTRLDRALVLMSASALPPIARFAVGVSDASSAFDRFVLNAPWFVLVWLPVAGAGVLVTGQRAEVRCERTTAFERRLWRFGAAFILLFVALTFVSKSGLSDRLQNVTTSLAFQIFVLGILLLVADVLPVRAQIPALQWTWAIMVGVCLIRTRMPSRNSPNAIVPPHPLTGLVVYSTENRLTDFLLLS